MKKWRENLETKLIQNSQGVARGPFVSFFEAVAELHSHGFIHKASGVAVYFGTIFGQSNDGSLGPGMFWKDKFPHQKMMNYR